MHIRRLIVNAVFQRFKFSHDFQILLQQDKIFFIPLCAKYIAVYHLRQSEITYIPFEGHVNLGKFSEAVRYKKYLYLFPAKMSHIVRLNMQTEEILPNRLYITHYYFPTGPIILRLP